MKEPLVSILMPFKNTASFLKPCLDSVLRQSYTKWELLAINDHSTDHSEDIVKECAKKDPRIRLFESTGNGIIPALRLAYSKSCGQLITRMDSDDIMKAEKLRVLVRLQTKHGPGHIALGGVKYFSERGISNGYSRYEAWLNELTAKGENFSDIYKECVIPSPCWMARRDDLNSCGAFNPDRYPEDYDLVFRFYQKKFKCIPCKQVLHLWRDYDDRTSRTSEHYAQNYFLDIKLDYFLKLDRDETRPLAVWGAGTKGKTIAQKLVNKGVPFLWVCDNPKKIGKKIYGVMLEHYKLIEKMAHTQSIITVANTESQRQIRAFLGALNQKPSSDYFFFC